MKKLEIIPQNTYSYGDGVPAYQSGEWPGSKSSHFKGSKLILKPIKNPEKPFILSHLVHFPQRYSEEFKFVPGRRILHPIVHDNCYKPTKRYIIPKYSEPKIYQRSISRRPPEQMNSDIITPIFQKKIRVNLGGGNKNQEWGWKIKWREKKEFCHYKSKEIV